MNLDKKKKLASRALKVGKSRIHFDKERLDEIKEAITSQDMRDLKSGKAIKIKETKGRRKNIKRTTRKGPGKIKKKVKTKKQDYVKITRKLRAHIKNLKNREKISHAEYKELRKMIRASKFKSKAHFEEQLKEMRRK